ncbi:MAG TPA: SDR family NAD(P)-dependent oxidoreductase, partial [Micropepsaceae bacterium]
MRETDSLLKGRIVLVTGASRGIGRAVAVALGRAGAHVVAVARTVGGLEELDDDIKKEGGTATLVPLDLKDFAGIDRMAAAIHERWGRLDALFGNAGILGALTPLSHLSPKTWDDLMAINVTANWRLIRDFDPLLRQSDAGRVLMMSSAVARLNRPYWGPYAIT